jgi:HEAT repeat protein
MTLSTKRLTVAALLASVCWLVAPLSAITSSKPMTARDAVSELVDQIEEQNGVANIALFARLTKIGTLDSLEAIQKLASKQRNPQQIEAAYLALQNYRGLPDLEPRAIRWLEEETQASQAPPRRGAAQALAKFGSAAEGELMGLVSRSKDPAVRAYAVGGALEAYVAEGDKAALKAVLENAKVGVSAPRGELLKVLVRFTSPTLDSTFGAALKDKEVSVKMKLLVIETLTPREGEDAEKALLAGLKDKAADVQIAAMVALDTRGVTRHGAAVSKLTKSKDESVRRQAIISLSHLNGADEGWISDLEDFATDKDPSVRMGAAVALAEVRTPEALQQLYLLLADPDHLVRREALQQVGNLRRKETLPALIMRLNGETGRLKADLLTTLRLITGLDHGTAFERWNRWWKQEGATFELPSFEEAQRLERKREQDASGGRTSATFYGLKVVSDRICFILDVSGSMLTKSGQSDRMEVAREQLLAVLQQFPDGDLFNIIFFASDAFPWEDELVPMSDKARKEALKYVERQNAGGTTAIYNALELAFQDRRIDTIFLLTDGQPAGGKVDDPDTIRADVKRWNANRHIRIHGIAIGQASPLLRNLSSDTGGDYKEVR